MFTDLTEANRNHTMNVEKYAFLIVTVCDQSVNGATVNDFIISFPGSGYTATCSYTLRANGDHIYTVKFQMTVNPHDKFISFADTYMIKHTINNEVTTAYAPVVLRVIGISFI